MKRKIRRPKSTTRITIKKNDRAWFRPQRLRCDRSDTKE
jgi:hypothetical protein